MDRTCDTCGQRVGLSSGSDGTCSYEPVAERECDSLRTENARLSNELSLLYNEWGQFRFLLREAFEYAGIRTNPGWSDADFQRAIDQLTEKNAQLRTENLALQKRYMAACEHEKRLEEALEGLLIEIEKEYYPPGLNSDLITGESRKAIDRARAALGRTKP